jgi:hypothetical protein
MAINKTTGAKDPLIVAAQDLNPRNCGGILMHHSIYFTDQLLFKPFQ